MANSNSTTPDNFDPKVKEVCDDIELLSSLKCECGASRGDFETIAIICRGRNNFKQSMVYSNGKIILTETCVNYVDSSADNKKNLVCVKEYYYDFSGHGSEPATCEASVDGERCPFCMPKSRGYFKESPDCQHGLSVRCGDAGYGSICTLPDGTKRMTQFITSNTYNRKYSSTSGSPVVTAVCFLAFVLVFAVAKLLRHGPESPNGYRTNYDEVELHNEMA